MANYFLLDKMKSEELEIYNLHGKTQQFRNKLLSHTERRTNIVSMTARHGNTVLEEIN
jgi:hypothetical protein